MGSSLLACLVELLAPFRPDPVLTADLNAIIDNDEPAQKAALAEGLNVGDWAAPRQAATARLSGTFCDVTNSATIAALYPRFRSRAASYGLPDFDAAALKAAEPRLLTQEVSQHLWEAKAPNGGHLCDGIEFRSRHGDNLLLWAIYERPGDMEITPHIAGPQTIELHHETPELVAAAEMLNIPLR